MRVGTVLFGFFFPGKQAVFDDNCDWTFNLSLSFRVCTYKSKEKKLETDAEFDEIRLRWEEKRKSHLRR